MKRKKQTKLKLRKWVKVAITILVILFSTFVYVNEGTLGELRQNSNMYLYICIMGWFWLFFGQIAILNLLWEE